MTKYRKKPVVIEAFRYGIDKEPDWFVPDDNIICVFYEANYITIDTLEGVMRANKGDWIIKGIKGELYPCKHEIFIASYEEVNDE